MIVIMGWHLVVKLVILASPRPAVLYCITILGRGLARSPTVLSRNAVRGKNLDKACSAQLLSFDTHVPSLHTRCRDVDCGDEQL